MAAASGKAEEPRLIEEEMKSSYLNYAMSVIIGRALPDVRDGLKPVHRRILYAMGEMGLVHSKPFKKSARVVGEVLGKYHPHGDLAVYDSLVRMAQPFSMRYPLVDGQGNFGSIDGDNAAAMRYTETRLHRLAEELLQDLDQETVDFQANFDASLKEPIVLPSKVPNLLLNGSTGIAVGMTTNIPPFNFREVIDATLKVIEQPGITGMELLDVMPGPDFPTGGIIVGTEGIRHLFARGRGHLIVRGRVELEKGQNDRERLIITEIPYQLNKSQLIEEIAELVKEKRIEGISDLRDESDREGMRVVIELKRNEDAEVVKNLLFKHSRLQSTYSANMVVIVDNGPKVLNVCQIIHEFLKHRTEVVTRRARYQLAKAEERAHILEGIVKALDQLDSTIQAIRKAKGREEATKALTRLLGLTIKQAKAILEMRLQSLTSLEQEGVRNERDDLLKKIIDLKDILASPARVTGIIKDELREMRERYGDERRTEINENEEISLEMEDLIKEEDVVVTVSNAGYAKRVPIDTYRTQNRGGKGIIGTVTRDEDSVKHMFISSTHSYLLVFTTNGRVYWLKVFQIPEGSRQAQGKALVNLVGMSPEERVSTILPLREFDERYTFFVTKNGTVKKTSLGAYSHPRNTGIIAISLDEGDEVVDVLLTDGKSDILLASREGMSIAFNEQQVREMGRGTRGVRGIALRKGDRVSAAVVADNSKSLFTITENGYGKRTHLSEYRRQNRGGMGLINIKTAGRNGAVVDAKAVSDDDELMLISRNGIIIRVPVNGISEIGRNTMGVTVMRMDGDDKVINVAALRRSAEGDEEIKAE